MEGTQRGAVAKKDLIHTVLEYQSAISCWYIPANFFFTGFGLDAVFGLHYDDPVPPFCLYHRNVSAYDAVLLPHVVTNISCVAGGGVPLAPQFTQNQILIRCCIIGFLTAHLNTKHKGSTTKYV